jgi:hypothetical protein
MLHRRRDPDDRSACLAPVVEHLERKRQGIRRLSDHDHLAEGLREEGVGVLGKDRATERRERLGRAEALTGPADEQRPGYASIRQGSE